MTFLCLASYFKGNRFLERCKADGHTVYLLTVEGELHEPWARHACDDVFAVNTFHDRRGLINAVAYLMRSRKISELPVVDGASRPIGMLDITDLIGLEPADSAVDFVPPPRLAGRLSA